jgi:hypothetical protein
VRSARFALLATVRAPWACLSVALLAAAGLAGCGSEKPKILDTERIERAIEKRIYDTRRRLRSDVSCPSGVEQKKGKVFRCTAVYAGGRTTFVVTQDDDKGSVHYRGLKK